MPKDLTGRYVRGMGVYVSCEVKMRNDSSTHVLFALCGKTLSVKNGRVSEPLQAGKFFCQGSLIAAINGFCVVSINQTDNKPELVKVPRSHVFYKLGGELFPFRNWREANQRRRKNWREKQTVRS